MCRPSWFRPSGSRGDEKVFFRRPSPPLGLMSLLLRSDAPIRMLLDLVTDREDDRLLSLCF